VGPNLHQNISSLVISDHLVESLVIFHPPEGILVNTDYWLASRLQQSLGQHLILAKFMQHGLLVHVLSLTQPLLVVELRVILLAEEVGFLDRRCISDLLFVF
jgi:hypothetical protein